MSGMMAKVQGHRERARELLEESLRLSREADDKLRIAHSLLILGITMEGLGDLKRAKEFYEVGIVLSREIGYGAILARFLLSLGYTLLLEGDYERGAALNEEAAALLRDHGYKGGSLELALNTLGWAALLQGGHERARTFYEECLILCKELGNKWIASESLEGLACTSAAEGEAEWAARLFGAAEALREAVGYQHVPEEDVWREPYLAATRSRLDEASWQEAWVEGRAMSMEQAIDFALSEQKPVTHPSPDSEQPSSEGPPRLTPREKEVAILVARGLTNRQIASELFLSEHTVHHHVTNILKKLNLSSRQHVASRLSDR
jgi:DNA-binding CsgD family transcriptional regulator